MFLTQSELCGVGLDLCLIVGTKTLRVNVYIGVFITQTIYISIKCVPATVYTAVFFSNMFKGLFTSQIQPN